MGIDIVGGIPHFERTMDEGRLSLKPCAVLLPKGGCRSIFIATRPTIRCRGILKRWRRKLFRHGLQGRVAGSHLTSMHSMDNYYVSKLIPLMAEARINVIPNPLINIMLQGRHDTYPKRRGMTRVRELMAAGLNVSFGQDCTMDPWYSMGSADMLEVGHMAIHVAQMGGWMTRNRFSTR